MDRRRKLRCDTTLIQARKEMFENAKKIYGQTLSQIVATGQEKKERIITTPQGSRISSAGKTVINFCANNYLDLANSPDLIAAAKQGLDEFGLGLSSVRLICGTQEIHKQLEQKISSFLGQDDAILYSSCYDANGGLFETLLTSEDAVISDALNHASIIDGIRLCKAQRYRFPNSDMQALEQCLKDSSEARLRLITTDGVFSMDGYIAKLDQICELAEKYEAMVHVDDSHATGFFGPTGRGTPEHRGVLDRIDVITSTLGKALGGASGGFTAARKEVVDLLRQRSRPYIFSNTLAPPLVQASIKVFEMLTTSTALRDKLMWNAQYFRAGMAKTGLNILPGEHPITPVIVGDGIVATQMADALLDEGIYVIGFSFPVVPKGQARIRVQVSAGHSQQDLDQAIAAFSKVAAQMNLL